MSVFSNNLLLGAGGQSTGQAPFDPTVIGKSVWLDGSADGFTRGASDFDAEDGKEFTLGTWFQLTEFGVAGALFCAGNGSGTYTSLQTEAGSHILSTTAVFRDIAWYHILVSVDTTQAISSNRVRMLINGVEATLSGTYPALNHAYDFNLANVHEVGDSYENGAFEGYLAQSFMIGTKSIQQGDFAITDFLNTHTFGTNGSQFIPKTNSDIKVLVDAGSDNSFLLNYEPADPTASNALGLDISTYANNFTSTSIDSANQSTNTPSLVYPTMNPLNDVATVVLSEGNTRVNAQANASIRSTAFASAGKRYAEITVTAIGNSYLGVAVNGTNPTSFAATGAVACQQGGDIYVSSSSPSGNKCPSYTTGDVMGILIDVDADKFWVSKNGTFYSMDRNPTITLTAAQVLAGTGGFDLTALGSDGSYGIHVGNSDGTAADVTVNFGQSSFSHTPPTGYVNWASENFDAPSYQGIDYFAPTLYEGNGEGQRVGDFVPFTDVYTVNNSAMFNEADERSFRRTPSSAGNQKTWTFSTWIKRTQANADYSLLNVTNSKEVQILLHNSPTGSIEVFFYNGSATDADIVTAGGFEDMSNWHNIVVAVDTRSNGNGGPASADDRIIIYVGGVRQTLSTSDNPSDDYDTLLNTATEHTIGQKPNGADDFQGYLAETVLIDGSQLTASSFGQVDTSTNRWVPKDVSGLTFGTNGFYLKYENSPTNIAASETGLKSDDLDVGAVSLLTDGTQYGSWNAGSNLVYQNSNSTTKSWWGVDFGSGVTKTIKSATIFGNQTGDGSSAGFTSVSGAVTWTLYGSNSAQATSDNDLSSLTSLGTASVADGITKGAAVTIDAASNTTAFRYFYVQMNTTASLRRLLGEIQLYETAGGGITNDSSGQNNDLVAAGAWVAGDQFTDTPSNNVFTFATDGTGTISEGNTRVDLNDSVYGLRPTIANFSSTGKFYGEFLVNAVSGNSVGIGFARDIASQDTTNPSTVPNSDSENFLLQLSDGNKINGDSTGVSYGSGISAGQTVMWAFDAATRKIWFGSEGTFFASGDPAAGTNEAFIIPGTDSVTLVAYDGSNARTANLTMRNATAAFEHTAPTGFTPFTQDNLDDTASKITAWAWIKNRDATDNHVIVDRIRGVGKVWASNIGDAAPFTNVNTVQRFLQRGVEIGSDVTVNTANESYVLWQWLLGDSATTGSTTSPAGTIASTTIVADTGHFSVGSYTGNGTDNSTVGHGLGGSPEMIIVHNLDRAVYGAVWHVDGGGATHTADFARNTAFSANDTKFGGSDADLPTANVFKIGTHTELNENTESFVFYTLRSIPGVCKVGSYVGNLNDDGPYVSTGFKPAWIMLKSATTARDWVVFDTSRDPINMADHRLDPSNSGAEFNAALDLDILSDGFKFRSDDIDGNASGVTYIYVAMADIGGNGTLPPVYGR